MKVDQREDVILRNKYKRTLREMSRRNALEIDNIVNELIKNTAELTINKLYNFTCKIIDFRKSITVTIPRRIDMEKCDEYRTISFLFHAFKILV